MTPQLRELAKLQEMAKGDRSLAKKPTRGGTREGAGRPTTINAAKTVAVRLDAENLEKLSALAEQWQCTPSEAIRVMIAACPARRPKGEAKA